MFNVLADMGSPPSISIAGRQIGANARPYLIAELSGNHNGDFARALQLLEAAANAGADAVKLQTYTADTITIDHDGPGFVIESGLWAGKQLHELYQEAHTPWEWHEPLFRRARELGVTLFSSPFDETAVELLEELGAPAYKIASFEAVDTPLIERVAATGKPMIISTGVSGVDEIAEAIRTAESAGCHELAVLHCVSAYPATVEESNLRTLVDLKNRFNHVTGLSDHSLGHVVAVTAVALGAAIVEKHFTLDRSQGGPDAAFSMQPNEFAAMVRDAGEAWKALGKVQYASSAGKSDSAVFRRSLYVVNDIESGEAFTPQNVRSIRPGFGLAPRHLREIYGRAAARDIARGTPLDWSLVAPPSESD